MHPEYIALIAIGIIVAIIIAWIVALRIRRKRREAPIWEWYEAANMLVYEDLANFASPPANYSIVPVAEQMAKKQDRIRKEIKQSKKDKLRFKQEAVEWLHAIQQDPDEDSQYEALRLQRTRERHLHYLSKDDSAWVENRLRELTLTHAQLLLAEMRSGDVEAYAKLVELTSSGYRSAPSAYWNQTGEAFKVPSDWDNVVAQIFKNPSLDEFRFVRRDVAPNDVRLMAAAALRSQSIRQAKIVLAFCAYEKYQAEVGIMAAELAKLVDAHHDRHGMFQSANTTTHS